LLNATTLSSLGCPLVTGTETGRSITPYRITLVYPQGSYTVHVSPDGTQTQLCDSKFGGTGGTPMPISSNAGACIVSVTAAQPARLAPNQSAAVVNGTFFTENKNTGIGRSRDNAWLQLRSTEGGYGWVEARTVSLSGNCAALPITAATDEDAALSVCYVTAASAFSNVRERPTVDARQVDQIFENVVWQVHVKSSDGGWYYINPGWVAASVIRPYGDCNNVRVNNDLVGRGSALMSATALPSNFMCPANFTGYLPPRLQIGTANARVIQDGSGIPNRIRSEPATSGVFIGEAQPGRTFDRVLDGPACSSGYVWWLVELDGVVGWTVESDVAENEYFLELIAPSSATPPPTAVPIIAPIPVTTLDVNTNPAQPTTQPATTTEYQGDKVVVSPDGNKVALWNAAEPQAVQVYWFDNGAPTMNTRFSRSADVVDLAILPSDELAILDASGELFFQSLLTPQQSRRVTVTPSSPTIRFSPDGSLFLTVGCGADPCTVGQISLWDTQRGVVLRQQPAHTGAPYEALFSPDGTRIASSGPDGIQLWDTRSGAFITGFAQSAPAGSYSNVVFVQNGQQIVRANCKAFENETCDTPQITVWDIASGSVQHTLAHQLLPIINLATNADGSKLISTSLDANPTLWDTATFTPQNPIFFIGYMIFSPDNVSLISRSSSTSSSTEIQFWNIEELERMAQPADAG
jgi:hypothetical protein